MAPNTRHNGFCICHFVHNYKHNSKTKDRIRRFYLLNDCSAVKDVHSLAVCEIWSASYGSKHALQPLSNKAFCVYLHKWIENYRSCVDVLHVEWLLYYWRCLFSVLELDVRYEWWFMPPNTYCQSFSNRLFVCIQLYLRHITWRLQVTCGHSAHRTTAILLDTFLCGLELHERSDWGATAPDTHCSFSGTTLCAYTASMYIHHYFIC